MKTLRSALMAVTATTALLAAGASHATTYLLNVDACSASCIVSPATNAGTIDVTSIAGGLHFVVSLGPNILFNQAGQGHEALGFDLLSNPMVTLTNFVETNVASAHPTGDFGLSGPTLPPLSESGGGAFNAHSFGTGAAGFGYGFDWVGSVANNGSLFTTGIKTLTFDALGSSLALGDTGGTPPVFFSVDVARLNSDHIAVATGLVGATLNAVPEPAAWGLMIIGFGGVGAVLRRRRTDRAFVSA